MPATQGYPDSMSCLLTTPAPPFFQDLLTHGVETSGTLIDRRGSRWILFDVDGTRETKRLRAVTEDPVAWLPNTLAENVPRRSAPAPW